MNELRHNLCGGKVKKTPEKFMSENLKKRGLTHYCFFCGLAVKPTEVEKKEEEPK